MINIYNVEEDIEEEDIEEEDIKDFIITIIIILIIFNEKMIYFIDIKNINFSKI